MIRDINGAFTDWSLFIDSYIDTYINEWDLRKSNLNELYNLADVWPNEGIKLPFIKNRLFYLELLSYPNKLILTDYNINLVDDLPLHTRFQNTGADYKKKDSGLKYSSFWLLWF